LKHLPKYPEGTVRALLRSPEVTPATRRALEERLAHRPNAPCFFDAGEYATLRAICVRLFATDTRPIAIDVAGAIDERLAKGEGDGWRYAALPPDGECHKRAMHAFDEMAQRVHGKRFHELDAASADAFIADVEAGRARGDEWRGLDAARFFEELLAEACERFYSHPLAFEEIGFAGMADAHGWQALGLGAHEPREPEEK
jgi:gluconate 2-dehydrogenase gamma chain